MSRLPDEVSLVAVGKNKWAAVDTANLRALSVIRFYYMRPYVKTKDGQMIHRIVADCPKGLEVDHVNGDRMDNRRCNLRTVTHAENLANSVRKNSPTSGFRGVSDNRGRYQARYSTRRLGTYDTREKAALVRDDYVREAVGDSGVYNFPRPGERSAITGEIRPLEEITNNE